MQPESCNSQTQAHRQSRTLRLESEWNNKLSATSFIHFLHNTWVGFSARVEIVQQNWKQADIEIAPVWQQNGTLAYFAIIRDFASYVSECNEMCVWKLWSCGWVQIQLIPDCFPKRRYGNIIGNFFERWQVVYIHNDMVTGAFLDLIFHEKKLPTDH